LKKIQSGNDVLKKKLDMILTDLERNLDFAPLIMGLHIWILIPITSTSVIHEDLTAKAPANITASPASIEWQ
jgi:hypothetical protein